MLGILRDGGGKAIDIFNAIEVNLEELRRKVEILNPAALNDTQLLNDKKNLHLTRQAERAFKNNFFRG
jgi:ATP-dependent Clp protease ATP-binding subunit ClpC